uniref:Aa_trans domain-containing protein n=1 Tax=Caenorhabditis japonica TaxID=281687 RepID=A0A8R1HH17_CAEJA
MDQRHINEKGMSMLVTALFIVGETAGGGLIALPTAILSTGALTGAFLLLMAALICTYTGFLLAENWTILQELYPEYRDHCRKPYPAMGLRAVGPKFAHFVSAILQVTQFGTAVVFVLLAAKNGENMLNANFDTHVSFCFMIIVVSLLVFPFTLPKSPKDFWYAVVAAMVTTTVSVILIIVGAWKDYEVCQKEVFYPPINVQKTLMSFGTIMFSYGGHCAFPTIQHDMKKPHQFSKSVSIAFLVVFIFYLPVSMSGYLVYGSSLSDSIIPSIQD